MDFQSFKDMLLEVNALITDEEISAKYKKVCILLKIYVALGNGTGNPGVTQGQPVPLPQQTHTRMHGYG